MNITQRFEALLQHLKSGVYEKDTEIGMALMAAIAGESVLLLGPPGTAKSMIARRIKCAFRDATSFEYLMSRFSTPDEIFGPVSISRLKKSDIYERSVSGFMPAADIAFLDEIWKAGPAILNTLLTIINEKTFRNGNQQITVPLKLLIGASNELPADGEGLEALWDRFLVRMVSGCVKSEENFYKILQEETSDNADPAIPSELLISPEEYQQWTQQIRTISIVPDVLHAITYIRQNTMTLTLSDPTEEGATRVRHLYISDRRWKHIVHLLRTSAFIHGRSEVSPADLLPVIHCLWSEPDEIPFLRPIVVRSLFASHSARIQKLALQLSAEVKRARARRALQQMLAENYHRDDNKELFDHFYYRIDRYGTGNTYIFFVDYKNLHGYTRDAAPVEAVIYPDPHNPKRNIIRTMADAAGCLHNGVGAMKVKLYRDNDNIYLNGVQYPIHQLARGQRQSPIDTRSTIKSDIDYEQMVEDFTADIRNISNSAIYSNMFVTPQDKQEVDKQVKDINHDIALLRMDIQKLLYGE